MHGKGQTNALSSSYQSYHHNGNKPTGTPSTQIITNINQIKASKLVIISVNVQSLTGKLDRLRIELSNQNIDILAIQEVWQLQDFVNYSIQGYQGPIATCRKGRGGGVAFYIKKGITVNYTDNKHHLDGITECNSVSITCRNLTYQITNIYRPPASNLENFNKQLIELLENIKTDKAILLGDFNIDLLKHTTQSALLNNTMSEHGFQQIITLPTRTTKTSST